MSPERHLGLAQRIEQSVQRCGPADWEIKIEAAMLAGTHWANLALHRHGVSECIEDIIHTSMLPINLFHKYALVDRQLMDALAEIEELRPLYVRGDVQGGPAAADRALALLGDIARLAQHAPSKGTGATP